MKTQGTKGKTMKASEINLDNAPIDIELPNTDAVLVIRNAYQLGQWIETHGDLEVEYDEKYKIFRVPSFIQNRKKYSDLKQADCEKFGSE